MLSAGATLNLDTGATGTTGGVTGTSATTGSGYTTGSTGTAGNGTTGAIGTIKFTFLWSSNGTKLAMLGVSVLFARAIEDARAAGVEETEYSWMLEHNHFAINVMHRMGARLTRTFRIYERAL